MIFFLSLWIIHYSIKVNIIKEKFYNFFQYLYRSLFTNLIPNNKNYNYNYYNCILFLIPNYDEKLRAISQLFISMDTEKFTFCVTSENIRAIFTKIVLKFDTP